MARPRIYTEEEAKERRREVARRWRMANRDKIKKWREDNRERLCEKRKQWVKDNYERFRESLRRYQETPLGRANHLLNTYRSHDRQANRGECDLTAQWIVENIFTKQCAHCEKTGWRVIGCNRLDNSKPHTMDNVEPCCMECNRKVSGGRYKKMV